MKKIHAFVLLLAITLAGIAHAETMPVTFLDELKKDRAEKQATLNKIMTQGQQLQQKMKELEQQALVLRGAVAQADETIKKLEIPAEDPVVQQVQQPAEKPGPAPEKK